MHVYQRCNLYCAFFKFESNGMFSFYSNSYNYSTLSQLKCQNLEWLPDRWYYTLEPVYASVFLKLDRVKVAKIR